MAEWGSSLFLSSLVEIIVSCRSGERNHWTAPEPRAKATAGWIPRATWSFRVSKRAHAHVRAPTALVSRESPLASGGFDTSNSSRRQIRHRIVLNYVIMLSRVYFVPEQYALLILLILTLRSSQGQSSIYLSKTHIQTPAWSPFDCCWFIFLSVFVFCIQLLLSWFLFLWSFSLFLTSICQGTTDGN